MNQAPFPYQSPGLATQARFTATDVEFYKARTLRFEQLREFVRNVGFSMDTDSVTDVMDSLDDDDARAARTLTLLAAYQSMRRIAEEP